MQVTQSNTVNQTNWANQYRTTSESTKVESGSLKNDAVNVSRAGSDRLHAMQELSKQYDVKNISDNDMNTLSRELYDLGEISLGEHALITSQVNIASGKLASEVSGNPMTNDGSNKRNYIQHFEQVLAFDRTAGSSQKELQYMQGIIDKLRNFDSMAG